MLILGSQNILSGNYAAISYQFLSFFFLLLFCALAHHVLLARLLVFCFLFFHCAFVALVPLFLFLRLAGAALAVEIKVIKDLPWPPPVGQLNSTPTVVEELESPTQTAQAPPGQTCCDQHHHGGCCAHILPVCRLRPSLSVHRSHTHPSSVVSPSVMSRNEACTTDCVVRYSFWFVSSSSIRTSVPLLERIPPRKTLPLTKAPRNDELR